MKEVYPLVIGEGYDKIDILRVYQWETPVSFYREERYGSARIVKVKYDKGLYLMEGVAGYDFFEVKKPIKITVLEILEESGWKTVMLDDPLHDYGMKGLALKSSGKVLVAGLGLGLIAYYLYKNPNVASIDIVEENYDVIKLIGKYIVEYLPTTRIKIIHKDIWRYIDEYPIHLPKYDYAILDIWSWDQETPPYLKKAYANEIQNLTYKTSLIANKVYTWGIRKPEINPAIRKIVVYQPILYQ